jgi:hypothetical protein
MNKTNLLFVAMLAGLSLFSANRTFAQDSSPQPDRQGAVAGKSADRELQASADDDVQLLRKDLRSQKKQIVAANMSLTDAEAVKFWPVYDQYAADLAKINDTKAAVIKDYLKNYTAMNGDQAEDYIRRRGAIEEEVMALRFKYISAFRKVLSGRETALFFQIDWRLGLMIDLQLAQMPLIDP